MHTEQKNKTTNAISRCVWHVCMYRDFCLQIKINRLTSIYIQLYFFLVLRLRLQASILLGHTNVHLHVHESNILGDKKKSVNVSNIQKHFQVHVFLKYHYGAPGPTLPIKSAFTKSTLL